MNCQTFYINFIVKHPYIVLLAISVLSCTCLVLPFTIKRMGLPNFQEPEKGFSTRGTTISNALIAWRNLYEESSKASGSLIRNMKEYLQRKNINASLSNEPYLKRQGERRKYKKPKNKFVNQNEIEYDQTNGTIFGTVILAEGNVTDGPATTNVYSIIKHLNRDELSNKHTRYEKNFCGSPDQKYVHVVIGATANADLFTLPNLHAMCQLQDLLMEFEIVPSLCISNTQTTGKCCKPWSLPNYIGLLNGKSKCLSITEDDLNETKSLLHRCAPYFHNNQLHMDCFRNKDCKVPLECIRHDAVFIILNYLVSISFLPREGSANATYILEEAIIFLPIASSIASVPFYYDLEKMNKKFQDLLIVAMDFGLKSVIFDEYLLRDVRFMCIGAFFIFLCLWVYTSSVFLTVMTIIAIIFAMAITYFLYFVVYEIDFFPFMNLLTIVICIGVGADDVFIFCKIWEVTKNDQSNENNVSQILLKTFGHAFKSLCVTTLTTAVAFLGSYVSSVMAVTCFSIFAGTAIIVNFVLMVTWFPACLVIWEQSTLFNNASPCNFLAVQLFKARLNFSGISCKFFSSIWRGKKKFMIDAIIRFKYFWIVLFTAISMCSAVVVFVYPKLKLPSSTDLQLFSSSHPFETYDFIYKNKFWFRREKGELLEDYQLPLRFVWGVLPTDNGDHLNPSDLGVIEFDPNFDMADNRSQEWLYDFCKNLKQQPFFKPTMGISLTNCFIETFVESMDRNCLNKFDNRNLTPCCNISKFPFDRNVFDTCIIEEMVEVYTGSSDYTYPETAGVMFSKETPPRLKAVVVEFNSNYTMSMSYENIHGFYTTVNEWTIRQLGTAPATMKNGFFVSDLDFYDLQQELSTGTKTAIVVSMALAAGVLLMSTLNPVITSLAIITITFTIITTIAMLVLCGWTLNILESIAISTAIGLDVDFSLHYCINYGMCPPNICRNREDATRYALSRIMGPSFMAAFTTAAAGYFMTFSLILPYHQIGTFLVALMSVSWLYSTVFLGALLAAFGPMNGDCQYTYTGLVHSFLCHSEPERMTEEPIAGTSSSHDLDRVSFIRHDTPMPVKKKSFKEPKVLYTHSQGLADQSPLSNITIIMADDN